MVDMVKIKRTKNNFMPKHYEESIVVDSSPEELFAFVDNHQQFSSHMNKSSWMMGGGHMETTVDAGNGQKVGSHIRMSGTAFGMKLFLDEVVIQYEPPYKKTWKTVGSPELIVIGHYGMGLEIKPQNLGSSLRVFIDYELPAQNAWLGILFGDIFAKWCVHQMIEG